MNDPHIQKPRPLASERFILGLAIAALLALPGFSSPVQAQHSAHQSSNTRRHHLPPEASFLRTFSSVSAPRPRTGLRYLVEISSVIASVGTGAAIGIWAGHTFCIPPPTSDDPWAFSFVPRCFAEHVAGGVLGSLLGFAAGFVTVRTVTRGIGTIQGTTIGTLVGIMIGVAGLVLADSPREGVPIAVMSTIGGAFIGYALSAGLSATPSSVGSPALALSISPIHDGIVLQGSGRF